MITTFGASALCTRLTSIVDFANPSTSVLTVNGVSLSGSSQLSVQNWANMVDYFYSNTSTGTIQLTNTGNGTALTVANGFTNAGLIDLQASGGQTPTLNVTAGTLTNTGTLRSSGAGNATSVLNAQLTNAGTLDVLRSLAVSNAGHTLDFGTGDTNALTFSSLLLSTYKLAVTHWTGAYYTAAETADHGLAAQDRLLFGSLSLTTAQRGQISFYNDAGGFIGTGKEISFGGMAELAPVPEPTTIFGALALVGFVGWRERRRLARGVRAFFQRSDA